MFNIKFELYENELKKLKETNEILQSENEQLYIQIENLKIDLENLNQLNKSSNENQNSLESESNPNENPTTPNSAKFKLASAVKPAPRLFCDICDEFDLHDTEDCPQQSSMPPDQNEFETHSKYNLAKSSNRDYCDLCEQFGHEEQSCPNQDQNTSDNNNNNKVQISDEEF